jgi:hypothetical protein
MLPTLAITPEAEKDFVEDIIKGTARVVSDGSYASGRSSLAFNTLTDTPITGSNSFPGDPRDQSSYRGELGGILPAIIVTNHLCKKYNISKGHCTMGCDYKGALSSTFGWRRPSPRWACYDIVSMIRYHMHNSLITWEGHHVILTIGRLQIFLQTQMLRKNCNYIEIYQTKDLGRSTMEIITQRCTNLR